MLLELVFVICTAVVLYHHFLFPALLSCLKEKHRDPVGETRKQSSTSISEPHVTLIVPAYNEAALIADKIANLDALEYPNGKLAIVIVCDGPTDETVAITRRAIAAANTPGRFELRVHPENRGKVAVLNETISSISSDIVALSDVSAMLEPDALASAVRHFTDHDVGVVCPGYELRKAGSSGEDAYWRYQTKIKQGEAALGAPMGAHGAFYLIRRDFWQPLEPDTINDDFVLPMRIVNNGARSRSFKDACASAPETFSK